MNLKHIREILLCYWVFIHAHTNNLTTLWHIIKLINGAYIIVLAIKELVMDYIAKTGVADNFELLYKLLTAHNMNGKYMY